ncbi:MAG: competence/damage-inducible protein A [Limnochordia bacterium]|jgi:nicotinamide-nucleotide amidase
MRAELVMVGTELLLGEVLDTNSQWLAAKLAEIGVHLYFKSTVGDNSDRLARVLTQGLGRSDAVIISGGLGPTEDDLTRQVVASVVDRPLVYSEAAERHVRQYFRRTQRPMPERVLRQAWLPEGATPIPNPRGTALGIWLETEGKLLVALPGVPSELKTMAEEYVLPRLVGREGARVTHSRVLHFCGIGESSLEELVDDLIRKQTNPTIAPYASLGEARLRLTAHAPSMSEAQAMIEPLEQEIRRRAGHLLYGADGCSLEQAVGDLLVAQDADLATVESCTGGLLAHRLTNVPGSSRYMLQGWITYSNKSKMTEVDVPHELIDRHGAVSAEVAEAMALGARRCAGSTYALATTGIAGPGGGTDKKPVGLVYIALAGPRGTVEVIKRHFPGDRLDFKKRTTTAALDLLRLHLLRA